MKSSQMVSHTKTEFVPTVSETVSAPSSVSDMMSKITACLSCVDHLIKKKSH
jgi:hypothetical protein